MPLSTSKKLSLSFSLFNAVSLLLLLFSINVIYLFIWYYDQKKEGLYDMNMNYSQYAKHGMDQTNIQNFREYLLTKDVFIDYHNGKTECSDSLNIKINHNIKNVA
jgi:hypothetical protein